MSGCDGHKRDVVLIVVYMVLLVIAMFICFSEAKAEFEPSDAISQTRSQRKTYYRCVTMYGGTTYKMKRRKIIARTYSGRKIKIKNSCYATRPQYLRWNRTETLCLGYRMKIQVNGRGYSCRINKIVVK